MHDTYVRMKLGYKKNKNLETMNKGGGKKRNLVGQI